MIVLVGLLEFDGSATADCLAKVILKIPMSFWQENTTNISGKAFQKAGFQDNGWSRSGYETVDTAERKGDRIFLDNLHSKI